MSWRPGTLSSIALAAGKRYRRTRIPDPTREEKQKRREDVFSDAIGPQLTRSLCFCFVLDRRAAFFRVYLSCDHVVSLVLFHPGSRSGVDPNRLYRGGCAIHIADYLVRLTQAVYSGARILISDLGDFVCAIRMSATCVTLAKLFSGTRESLGI